MKVYIVTSGEYSDYSIEAVFSKKKLAEKYIKNITDWLPHKSNIYRIETWDIDIPVETTKIIQVHMDKNGNTSWLYHVTNDSSGYRCFDINDNLVWNVNTDSDEKAIKVVNEKRIQILAHNIWKDDNKVKELFNGGK